MMTVLDASALLAYLQNEPGAALVDKVLNKSVISTVNWAEVVQKSLSRGVDLEGLREDLEAIGLRILPFTVSQAEIAGKLWLTTRALGLSLGDRACLALGLELCVPVVTTDKIWQKLELGLEIHISREP